MKYKHKPTGKIYYKIVDLVPWYSSKEDDNSFPIPAHIVENGSDWEEVKEAVIPPGILVMYNDHVQTTFKSIINKTTHTYEDWYECFNNMGYNPHTILVDGVEWSVGDWYHFSNGDDHQIRSFEWLESAGWKIKSDLFHTYLNQCKPSGSVPILKGKFRKPICQLPDENGKMVDMFEGDMMYTVFHNWSIVPDRVKSDSSFSHHVNGRICFATKAAAERYIYNHKPVYPAGLVEPLVENYFLQYNMKVRNGMQNLKLFKDKLDKK